MSRTCLFCEIVAGRLPASVVLQDEACLCLMDIHPVGRGHALVIPRRHAARLHDLPAGEREHLFGVAERILAAEQRVGLARDGANLLLNDGSAANQHIPHMHIHLIPRSRGDGLRVMGRFAARMLNMFGLRQRRDVLDALARQLAADMADRKG
ncbi:HIT family protein [Paludibacterium paludis]|uniref:HIT family protein n=1 Tax=Paludibacterium paludis TaxID=1225769 RepID=A0A918P3I2_9NEIS|nr:HIT family protein [Paludibacterium paludis]GGY14682.1 HIT family protein [Paludibacterium paludis]